MPEEKEWSNTVKSTAIYLYRKKGMKREEVARQFGVTPDEFDDWVASEKDILNAVKLELTGHLLSNYI